MTIKRRTFLVGAASGLSVGFLAACTSPKPEPTPTITDARQRVPVPTAFHRASWSADPYSRGSFSYQAVGSTPQHRVDLRQPIQDRVFFAGEHTSDSNPGTVHGAESSGNRAATELDVVAEPGERIAVIGAGIAGATAARRLADVGYRVVVVEGRDRSGGRIDTITGDDGEQPIELGASWVLGPHGDDLGRRLTALDVETEPFDQRIQLRSRAGVVLEPDTIGPDAVTAAIDWAAMQPADVSIADAIVDSGAAKLDGSVQADGVSDVDRLAGYVTTNVVIESGAEAEKISSWYAPDPTRAREDDRWVTGGFSQLVTSALNGIDILPSSAVAEVRYSDDGVSLRLARGESLSVDRVIVTVPLGVLKSGSLSFDPPLPFEHRGAISALGMGNQDKLVLRFESPFWSTDATVWKVVGDDVDFPLWYNLEPLTGQPVLMALTGGEDAIRLAELSDQKLIEAALASLEPFADPALIGED